MKVLLVANDAGESQCLENINNELLKRGYETYCIFGDGRHLTINQSDIGAVLWADIFIATISNNNEAEVGLAQMVHEKNSNTPIVIYTPGSYAFQLKGTEPLRNIVNLLLVSNDDEIEKARKLYPNARVEAIGNILYEEFAPACSIDEARQIIGFAENRKIIFVPGDNKDWCWINWFLFQSVIQAAYRFLELCPMVVIGLH